MTLITFGNQNRTRNFASVLVCLQLLALVLVPVVHARAETWRADKEIEAAHTSDCVVIHSEADCSFCTNDQVIPHPQNELSVLNAFRTDLLPVDVVSHRGPRIVSSHGERAPPTS